MANIISKIKKTYCSTVSVLLNDSFKSLYQETLNLKESLNHAQIKVIKNVQEIKVSISGDRNTKGVHVG